MAKGNPNPNYQNIVPFQWKKGQSGNPTGARKNRVPAVISKVMTKAQAKKFAKMSNDEVDEWERTLLGFNTKQLQELAKFEDAPAYPRSLAIAILYDIKNGTTRTIEKLRERQYGTPVQRMELTGADGKDFLQQPTTPAEAAVIIAELEENC